MFEYQGQLFSLEQIEAAAAAKNLSLDEYITKFNIKKVEEPQPVESPTEQLPEKEETFIDKAVKMLPTGMQRGAQRIRQGIGPGSDLLSFSQDIGRFEDYVKTNNLNDDDVIDFAGSTFDPKKTREIRNLAGEVVDVKEQGTYLRDAMSFISDYFDSNLKRKGTVKEARQYYRKRILDNLLESEEYQDELRKLGTVSVLDGEGNIFNEVREIIGEQFPQLFTLGLTTMQQEGTSNLLQILDQKAIEKSGLSQQEYFNLPESKKIKLKEDILYNNEIDIDGIMKSAGTAGALDLGSNLFVVSRAAKFLPKQYIRQVLKGNLKNTLGKTGADVGLTSLVEIPLELAQEGLAEKERLKQIENKDVDLISAIANIEGKELGEIAFQTFIGSGGFVAGGQFIGGTKNIIVDKVKDYAAIDNPDATRNLINGIKEQTNKLVNDGKLTPEERNDLFDKLESTENFIEQTGLKNLSREQKRNAIDAIGNKIDSEKRISELQNDINNLNERNPELENLLAEETIKLNEANTAINKEIGLDLIKKDGYALFDYINSDEEGIFKGKKIFQFDTIEEAKKEIVKRHGKDALKDSNIKSLLDNESNGVRYNNDAFIVLDNIKSSLDIGATGSNTIHHEALHFVLDSMDDTEINSLVETLKSDLKETKDSDLKSIFEFAVEVENEYAKDKAYQGKKNKRKLNEEFLTHLSDGLREIEMRNMSNEDAGIFTGLAKKVKSLFEKNTTTALDINFNGTNFIEFLKRYNKFNDKTKLGGRPVVNDKNFSKDSVASKKLNDLLASFKGNKNRMISQTLTKTPRGEETFEFDKSEFGQAMAGLTESITKRLYDPIPADLKKSVERNQFKNDLVSEAATIVSNEYNPERQDLGKFLTNVLNLRANRLAKRLGIEQTFKTEISEARQIADDAPAETVETISISERLGLPNNIIEKYKSAVDIAILNTEKKLKGTEELSPTKRISVRNKAFNDIINNQIQKDISSEFGKKNFPKYLDNNFEALRDAALKNINFKKGKGITLDWNNNPPTKKQFVDYYIAEGENNSTKSDRKLKLKNAVIQELSEQLRKDYIAENPVKAKSFEEDNKISLASKKILLGHARNLNFVPYSLVDGKIDSDGIYANTKKYVKDIKAFKDEFPPGLLNASIFSLRTPFAKVKDSKITEARENSKIYLREELAKIDFGKDSKYAKNKAADLIGGNFKQIYEYFDNPNNSLQKYNNLNNKMFVDFWDSINNILSKPSGKKFASSIYYLLRTSVDEQSHPVRLGGEVVSITDNAKPNDKVEWEHAVQSKIAYNMLFEAAFRPKAQFKKVFDAVNKNYKIIGLTKSENALITKAGWKDKTPGRDGKPFNIFEDSWIERYIQTPGLDLNNQRWLVKGKNPYEGATEKSLASKKILSDQFNMMLEKVKGVKAEARYSEARAAKLGAKRNPFKFFVPYSAEDYMGLVYPTLGKGKIGNENLQWYKDNIITPYATGIRNFEIAKQEALNNWEALKKEIKNTPAKLNKEAVRDFTNEEAVRLYLWDKQNVLPEGIAQKDIKAINKYINDNPELLEFANQIESLTEDGYPSPTGDWLAGTITTDLINYTNTVSRADYLKQWQDNVDVVYSKENLNKLQALYGNNYVEALQDMLYRMKTGRNRPSGGNKLTNQYLNWVNNSVGGIMFFNTRSALLQTISAVNYVNFTDNNPLRVAKAFANQPQFWKDFSTIFNSDFLKQRRGGLKTDVNADEIARTAATAENKFRAGLAYLLKKGFIPTQYADSFAISFGGASFYRNRVSALVKEGMDQKKAEEQAFLDFKEITEESQQSSRPDRVSMQQASPLGRVILAFANTPMQYTRLTKKAALDLINGRGDWKTNLSKLIYYGAAQNIIFTSLQSALFALMFSDEEEEDEKKRYIRIANGSFDTLLRGSGVYGATVAMAKNIVLEAIKQAGGRQDFEKAALQITTLSPPIDSKIKKLMAAGRSFKYKQEREKMKDLGFSIDNPAFMATGKILSATVNLPLDRALQKAQNLKLSVDKDTELWQSIALALGYNKWDLNIEDPSRKTKKSKSRKDSDRRLKQKGVPLKKLENLPNGVLGKAHKDGTIQIRKGLSAKKKAEVLKHEKQHVKDMKSGRLNYDQSYVYWEGKKYPRTSNKQIIYNGKALPEGHGSFPWERAANKAV